MNVSFTLSVCIHAVNNHITVNFRVSMSKSALESGNSEIFIEIWKSCIIFLGILNEILKSQVKSWNIREILKSFRKSEIFSEIPRFRNLIRNFFSDQPLGQDQPPIGTRLPSFPRLQYHWPRKNAAVSPRTATIPPFWNRILPPSRRLLPSGRSHPSSPLMWCRATIDQVGPAKGVIFTYNTNTHTTKSGFLYPELTCSDRMF